MKSGKASQRRLCLSKVLRDGGRISPGMEGKSHLKKRPQYEFINSKIFIEVFIFSHQSIIATQFLEHLLCAVLGFYIPVQSLKFPQYKTCADHLPIHVLCSIWKCAPRTTCVTHLRGIWCTIFCIFVAKFQTLGNPYIQSCRLSRQLPSGNQAPHSLLQPIAILNFLVPTCHQVYLLLLLLFQILIFLSVQPSDISYIHIVVQ